MLIRSVLYNTGRGGAISLPVGTKFASLGDSLFARSHAASTSSVMTTMVNKANSEIAWALAMSPQAKHQIWWDSTATAAHDIPTYGVGSGQDNFYRGANFGYAGDTMEGMTRRTAQIISSGCKVCFFAGGTNTDTPNTAAQKIAMAQTVIAALNAAGIFVLLGTIRPRWSGERTTLTDKLSTTNGSPVVTMVHTAHGMTNTSAFTKETDFLTGITVGGITLAGGILNGVGGYSVNVVDANTVTFTTPTNATSTVTSGGGAFTYHRNVFINLAGVSVPGNCILPYSTRHGIHKAYNDWAIAQSGLRLKPVDLTAALRDATRSALTGVHLDPLSENVMDGVHATPKGAQRAAVVISAALNAIVPAGAWFDTNPATLNLTAAGNFSGTPTGVGSGWTGTTPAGIFLSNTSGAGQPVTGVASIENNTDTGGKTAVLVMTSTGAGTVNTFNQQSFSHTAITTGFVATDWVMGFAELEVSGASSGILVLYQTTLGETAVDTSKGMTATTVSGTDFNTEPAPQYNGRFWITGEPMLCEARANLTFRVRLYIRTDLAGSVTVRIRRTMVRKVPSPITEFPWVA